MFTPIASNYNALNDFANSPKVQLSSDLQRLLGQTTDATIVSYEEEIASWAKLPVKSVIQPAPGPTAQAADIRLLPAVATTDECTNADSEQLSVTGTGLRKLITQWTGFVFTERLPHVEAATNTLLQRLHSIIIGPVQEKKAHSRWFTASTSNVYAPHPYAQLVLEYTRMRKYA
jgi:hypothetical protein